MTKTIEDSFRDWEGSAFGFGYGTVEEYTIPALKKFLALCSMGVGHHAYDFRVLEAELTPPVAWLLINALARHPINIIEYGTSPRYGWLTAEGEALKAFADDKSAEELINIIYDHADDYVECYPDTCNCGPTGYQAGVICKNPFWRGFTREGTNA